ncbi:MAG: tRNA dihydrouridine synthase DusB [Endomicrobium sp.]|jgi:tRNA-dihydrouridine synthase B|nr:tRNA dihydrouridine synthase DusB [Endomicrobium sp.]
MKNLKIGNISLNNNIFLAPMAGITDSPLRILAKQGGAGLVYTEMISAKALLYNNEKTNKLLKISNQERPIAAQIFGGDIHSVTNAAIKLRDMGIDIIDINLGCPVKKVTKTGAGIALLSNERLIAKILEKVVKSVDIPVTIKIRIGLFPGQNIATSIIKIAQNSGIKMVVIHARAASQGHSGKPDLKLFAEACLTAKIPIIGNGGITDEKTASDFLNIPNCSGIMVGRVAIGNYLIFKRLEDFFNNRKTSTIPSKEEKMDWLKQHVNCSIKHYGEKKGLIIMRKLTNYYIRDLPNATKIRDMFNTMTTISDFNKLIKIIKL